MNSLLISLKTKNIFSLKKYLLALNLVLTKFNVNCFFFKETQKQKSKVFTVLKSPHVFKDSQDQFSFKLYINLKKLKLFKYQKLIVVIKNLQKKAFSDVLLKIKIIINELAIKTVSQNICSDKFILNNHLNTPYIKSFDLLGETLLNKIKYIV